MAYEKLNVYNVVKGPKGEQGEQGDQGDQGKGYTGPASTYSAYMDDTTGLSLHQVNCGKTPGVVWMVAETAVSIGEFIGELSYVTVSVAASGAEVLDAKYVTKCDNARFYKLSKNPQTAKTLFRQGGEEIRLTADGYLTYSNGIQSDDAGDDKAPAGFVHAPLGSSMQFSYFVHD